MALITAEQCGSQNIVAFLDCIAFAEGTARVGEMNGYDVIVTSTRTNPILFTDFSKHPNRLMSFKDKSGKEFKSSAAGRYQLLYRWWVAYSKILKLPNFEPLTQDRIAIQQAKERGAIGLLKQNKFFEAIKAASNIWASFPGAGYNQHEQKIETLAAAYTRAGGVIAGR